MAKMKIFYILFLKHVLEAGKKKEAKNTSVSVLEKSAEDGYHLGKNKTNYKKKL